MTADELKKICDKVVDNNATDSEKLIFLKEFNKLIKGLNKDLVDLKNKS